MKHNHTVLLFFRHPDPVRKNGTICWRWCHAYWWWKSGLWMKRIWWICMHYCLGYNPSNRRKAVCSVAHSAVVFFTDVRRDSWSMLSSRVIPVHSTVHARDHPERVRTPGRNEKLWRWEIVHSFHCIIVAMNMMYYCMYYVCIISFHK